MQDAQQQALLVPKFKGGNTKLQELKVHKNRTPVYICIAFVVVTGIITLLGLSGELDSASDTVTEGTSTTEKHKICCWHDQTCSNSTEIEYRGIKIWSVNEELSNITKNQIDVLLNCNIDTTSQPSIVVGPSTEKTRKGESYYSKHRECGKVIFLADDHPSLLVHEFVHYLEDIKFDLKLPCAVELYNESKSQQFMGWQEEGEWGWPYCYGIEVPNSIEFIAIIAEGYCTNQCGPQKPFLENGNVKPTRMKECFENNFLIKKT